MLCYVLIQKYEKHKKHKNVKPYSVQQQKEPKYQKA